VITDQHSAIMAVEAQGIASLAVRDLLHGPYQAGRVLAVVQGTIIAEFPGARREPRVIAISAPDAVRLPNAIVASISSSLTTAATSAAHSSSAAKDTRASIPGRQASISGSGSSDANPGGPGGVSGSGTAGITRRVSRNGHLIGAGGVIHVGRGAVHIGGLTVKARRWWDPSPVFGPLSRGRLDQGAAVLSQACRQAIPGPALRDHEGPKILAACCAAGDLAGAVEQAERLVGLGAGIIPGGDSVLCGLLLALRLLGGAIPGGTRAVWLADWLSAAVTSYASERTTPLAASLLYCASRGQAPAEVAAVLHGVAGEDPVEPAARRLLAARTAVALGTADLAWGLVAGCRAAQALSVS
jgi:Protein of unknown function (DUF2877)